MVGSDLDTAVAGFTVSLRPSRSMRKGTVGYNHHRVCVTKPATIIRYSVAHPGRASMKVCDYCLDDEKGEGDGSYAWSIYNFPCRLSMRYPDMPPDLYKYSPSWSYFTQASPFHTLPPFAVTIRSRVSLLLFCLAFGI